MSITKTTIAIAQEVAGARIRAHEKHGANSIESIDGSDPRWLSILIEEVGEAAHELTYDATGSLRAELIDIITVATAWVASLDRPDLSPTRYPTASEREAAEGWSRDTEKGDGTMSKGVDLIKAERDRQVVEEGYDAEHDRGHAGDLAVAGASYAFGQGYALQHPDLDGGRQYLDKVPAGMWPWTWRDWKPSRSAVRTLVKAGALIAAAIDSILESEGRES